MDPTLINKLLEAALSGAAKTGGSHAMSSLLKSGGSSQPARPLTNDEFERKLTALLSTNGFKDPKFERIKFSETELISARVVYRSSEYGRFDIRFSNDPKGVGIILYSELGVTKVSNSADVLALFLDRNETLYFRIETSWGFHKHSDGSGWFDVEASIPYSQFDEESLRSAIIGLLGDYITMEKKARDKFNHLLTPKRT